ncbi:MAG: excinuclease ABC subunit UvrA [Parvibaculales bacterium]
MQKQFSKTGKKFISVMGAREHNLKNLTLKLPKEKLIVMTGLSGSGKSSLAFDTIYAEGQRRYVESLSAYARQFLEMMHKPEVDRIDGLSPAISIEQRTTSRNPRSTVGTVTEIYDYMRVLFARAGVPYSPATGLAIESQSVQQMVERLMKLKEGTKFYLMAPLIRGRKGEHISLLESLQKRGFDRIRVDGKFYETIEDIPLLDKKRIHEIEVVVDRLIIKKSIEARLADSLEIALGLSEGLAIAELVGEKEKIIFSSRFACPISGFTIEEIEPRLFSFNSPYGACPVCDGLGVQTRIDEGLVVPEPSLSLNKGALAPWKNTSAPYIYVAQTLSALSKHYGFSLDAPWKKLPIKIRKILLHGSKDEEVCFSYHSGKRSHEIRKPFEGFLEILERRYRDSEHSGLREEIEKYYSYHDCKKCNGYRLSDEAQAVKIDGKHIGEICALSIKELVIWSKEVEKSFTAQRKKIAAPLLREIRERIGFLNDVGLGYLTLSRSSRTLSGGEAQRIRLASQIGSGLTGVLYVLDEPSIGLHQRDNQRLLTMLKKLKSLGNTLIVVEHDEEAILAADHVVDIGPLAGIHGGKIIAEGTPKQIMRAKGSLTGEYLSGKREIALPKKRREINPRKTKSLYVKGAKGNNLKKVDVRLPLGCFNCVTGVSGSGKSSFLIDTLFRYLSSHLHNTKADALPFRKIEGLEHIDKIVDIDQSPIGRTPRSNPATYTGLFTPIREWFTSLPESKLRGYKQGRFSFNVKGGRCEACQGDGVMKIEMHFLADVYVECDLCHGRRYNQETLQVKFRDKSIADVLDMTVSEALIFFKAVPAIRDKLSVLERVGLGYIHLGQQATTLSGGEAQRVKLARELSKRATGRSVYILDEPTTGLHFHDVAKLLDVLHEMVDAGNSVFIIEHNIDVIKTADWIVDFGPEGGDEGGEVVAQTTPEELVKNKKSYTGKYLASYLKRKRKRSA